MSDRGSSEPDAASGPVLTVVPCMYRRRQYILEALRSVILALHDVPSQAAEIVLVADEVDDELQEFARRQSVRIVRSTAPGVGEMMVTGLKESRGRFVAFLDDDDLVDPGRFLRFLSVHSAHPSVTYYHNGFRPFRDRPPNDPHPPAPEPRILRWPPSAPEEAATAMEFLASRNWEQNLSSTIVRGDVLLHQAPRLARITGLTDTFVFFASLVEGGTLVFDEAVGTWIRRHGSNTTSSPRDLLSKRETRDVVQEMVRASDPPTITAAYTSLRRARDVIFDASRGDEPSRKQVPEAITELLRADRSTHRIKNMAYVALALVLMVSPGLGTALGRRLVTVLIPEGVSRV